MFQRCDKRYKKGMTFAEKLAQLAASRELNQRDVLRKIQGRLKAVGKKGRGASTVNRWFNGSGLPTVHECWALAQLFEVPMEYLADDGVESPVKAGAITPDEAFVLGLFRDLRLTRQAASQALSAAKQGAMFTSGRTYGEDEPKAGEKQA
jgi:transcriptional regulator with XRE-family HTH domain